MEGRRDITKKLGDRFELHVDAHNDPRIYWAKEVTFDYSTGHQVRVDYMRFKPVNNSVSGIEKGDFYCYEIKSSVEDFRSKNGHNFIGDLNYYIMPEDVYASVRTSIPYNIGVMVPDEGNGLKTIKNAKRKDRSRPASEMLLMMWRSSRREVVAYRKSRRQEEKENSTPLTLKELRQMEGEPVWVKIIDASNFCDPKDAFDDYGLVRKSWVRMWDRSRADIITVSHHFEEYGKIWLAYRNKPKEAEEK